jgi:predicted membrane-bound mannosyltransferase
MPAKQPEKAANVRIVHDGVGPGFNTFTKGQVVPVEALKHSVQTPQGPQDEPWDIERLLSLGAVEYTDEEPTALEGAQAAPPGMDADAVRDLNARRASFEDRDRADHPGHRVERVGDEKPAK